MLDESRSHRLGPARNLREPELGLLRLLVRKAGENGALSHLDSLLVQEMSDGGMGSLYLVDPKKTPEQRGLGRRIAELQFADTDGVAILASLNVDQHGGLYEMDVWKVDFSPVIQLNPNPPD